MEEQIDRATVSTALAAAQEKLNALREAQLAARPLVSLSDRDTGPQQSASTPLGPAELPGHLGWQSAPLTAALRAAQRGAGPAPRQADRAAAVPIARPTPSPAPPTAKPQSIKLYPDVALGMLRESKAAPGRIWLLLRHLDRAGSGRISLATARAQLTNKKSAYYVCTWRQLRNLLAQGEGLFWQRNDGRIWLRSVTKAAAGLAVRRLSGRPVALPLSALLGGIGSVRAHFYASFHSGRSNPATRGGRPRPIARRTLRDLSRVCRRTQRNYEKRTLVRRQANYAVGARENLIERQNRAWKQGRAVFRYQDRRGLLGSVNSTYSAWQLPNNYIGPHSQQPKGRQKRINQELADLFNQGMTGNSKEVVHAGTRPNNGRPNNGRSNKGQQDGGREGDRSRNHRSCYRRRFHENGGSAARSFGHSPHQDHYWPNQQGRPARFRLWHLISGREE